MSGNDIVIVNVGTQFAPAPNNLQKKGAIVSVGGTNKPAGTLSLVTALADLTAISASSIPISNLSWATSVVTVDMTSPHGIPVGASVEFTIINAVPAAYNGTYTVTATDIDSFTYPLASNPGTATAQGSAVSASAAEVFAAATTYFANSPNNAVWVLELGILAADPAVAALSAWITANPSKIYAFLTPRNWATSTTFPSLVSAHSGNNALTYFFQSFTATNYAANAPAFAGMKAFFGFVGAPNAGATEFGAAAPFAIVLNRNPSNSNKVPPLQFAFLVGVTPGGWSGINTAQFKTLNLNYAITGAEGGITNTILRGGTVATGKPFNFWFSSDWAIINLQLMLSNTIINGSNNQINPLYYNQQGIDRLRAVAQQVVNSGISFGLFLAPGIVNAIDFITYTRDNPADFATGEYDGLSATLVPQNGFSKIIFNLVASDLVTG